MANLQNNTRQEMPRETLETPLNSPGVLMDSIDTLFTL